jgi:nucleotide-binding universal stress UspA family protein
VAATPPTVSEGTPFDRIIEYANDVDANLVVVGSRGAEPAGGSRLGTTAERLCRRSSRPVLVVAPATPPEPERILCPVDGSAPSKRALRNAIHWARRLQSQLRIVHVVPPISGFSGLIPAVQRGMQQNYVETETARFERLLADFDLHDVAWDKVVLEGNAAETILEATAAYSADLIIMGSVGRTGLSRMLLGSVAGKVVREMPCSIIMLKAEDAIRVKIDEELADLQTHYERGCELLQNGFLDEAQRQFQQCLRTSDMFAPAWEGLAETAERRGDLDRAEQCRVTAQKVEETLAWRRVEADVRRTHPLWKRK